MRICQNEECENDVIGNGNQVYCSPDCRPGTVSYYGVTLDIAGAADNRIYKCWHCGVSFTTLGRRRKYCSEICSSRGAKAHDSYDYLTMVVKDTPLLPKGRKIGDGYVYVIGASDSEGPVKIGKSHNPQERLSVIQSGNPKKLFVLYSRQSEDSDSLEAELHAKFWDHKLTGEWFDVSPTMVIEAMTPPEPPAYISIEESYWL